MALQDTPNGYNPYEVMSALQKCIRRGVEYDAYWWAEELVRNKQATMVWNRLEVIACEDVGIGDSSAIVMVHACREAWERVNKNKAIKDIEWSILSFPIIYMCRANKSRSADDLAHLVWLRKSGRDPMTLQEGFADPERLAIPESALDMHTRTGQASLREQAKKTSVTSKRLGVLKFRHEGARLNKPVRDIAQDGTNWTEEVCRIQGCDPKKALAPAKRVDEEY